MQFAIVYTLIEPNLEVGKGSYNSKPQKSKLWSSKYSGTYIREWQVRDLLFDKNLH